MLGPFVRDDRANPVLEPKADATFFCPMRKQPVAWERDNVFNPAATVRHGKVVLLYRAEDDLGEGIGRHTSRIGLAESVDGLRFAAQPAPVLFPAEDAQKKFDWPGGCEDPRVVETPGGYLMTYTAWDRRTARLSVAVSRDLRHWQKCGPAFAKAQNGRFLDTWSKSGAIVTRRRGDHLTAAKIGGRYWMYWGEGPVYLATSQNLRDWSPVLGPDGKLLPILSPRKGKFDSGLTESGPPAVLTPKGVVLVYNGKNADRDGDPSLPGGVYSAGQALFDPRDPSKLLDRSERCFFKPERPYEVTGQYARGTVFVEGLVFFQGRWRLYYGTADSKVAVASTR